MEPFSQYAVAAAKQAIDDSGLDIEKEDPYMVGCAIGSGTVSYTHLDVYKRQDLDLSQTAFLCAIPNSPTYYDPINNKDHTLTRRNLILKI